MWSRASLWSNWIERGGPAAGSEEVAAMPPLILVLLPLPMPMRPWSLSLRVRAAVMVATGVGEIGIWVVVASFGRLRRRQWWIKGV